MSAPEEVTAMEETLDQMQARHRKEQRNLVSRVTNKKKNATKKTRRGVNEECAELERQLKERQEEEMRKFTTGGVDEDEDVDGVEQEDEDQQQPPEDTANPNNPQPKQNATAKDRLARRAAEVLAASAAASTEASSMTDHRALERTAMAKHFATHSLREHEIAPDGHCLFSAVADQLDIHQIPLLTPHQKQEQRMQVVGGGERPNVMPYRVEYARKIGETAEWGGQLELSALANAYGVEIRVVQGGGRVEVVAPTEATGVMRRGWDGERKTIWLAYYRHGYGLGSIIIP
ncbi:OTU protein [Collariella sp. IMI 366227]|nr:OTU protein [Collariella sp. IMI 366227]